MTEELRSALGQTLPSHSALVQVNVCCSPLATVSRTSRERREGPICDIQENGTGAATRIYLTTIDAFSVGVIEKANQVFQPDDRFCAANSQ